MELAIPLVALGGLYVVSNNSNNDNRNNQNVTREGFTKLESNDRQYNHVNRKPLVKEVKKRRILRLEITKKHTEFLS